MCSEKCLAIHTFSNKHTEKNRWCHGLFTYSMWQTNRKINFTSRSEYQEKMIFINMKQTIFYLKSRVSISLAITNNVFFVSFVSKHVSKRNVGIYSLVRKKPIGTFLNIKKTTRTFFTLITPFIKIFRRLFSCSFLHKLLWY